ncbi:GATA transcription factor 26 [Olea europaea subsp. europaea]|uniref:GATA transcription factor 26 n=2 Tax=Olea europaea subsp. europaea TaxID=158383 RepID=A0A8S0R3H4_OLEEU|nr:GATA transcription factor 26 [Olea europaea subsp. europaea]
MGKQGPCYHCGVTSTPLWRNGPPEKPVLCNACGSRWRTKGTLANYTPLHARAEYDDDEKHRVSKVDYVSIKSKREKGFKRKQDVDFSVFGGFPHDHNQGFRKGFDEDTSNRSSSGSAISNPESCVQYGSADASDLTGPPQSIVWDTMVPSKKRTCFSRSKPSPFEKITKDLYTIWHEQQSSCFSGTSEEELLLESDKPMVSVETGHGSVLIRHPNAIAREEESEASSLPIDNKLHPICNAYSQRTTLPVRIKKPAGQGTEGHQIKRDKDQLEKLQMLRHHNSPLRYVDLQDILNFDKFVSHLTYDEQQQLLKILPSIDISAAPESLISMFDSPQFKENLSSFQKLLAEGVFDNSLSGVKTEDCRTLKKLALGNLTKSKWVEQYNVHKDVEGKNCIYGSETAGGLSAVVTGHSVNVKRSRDGLNSGLKTMMKSPRRVIIKSSNEQKEPIDSDGSCFSPKRLFSSPNDNGSLVLDSFRFADGSSEQDLLLDVPCNSSFPQAELLRPTSSFGAQASTSSSSVHPHLFRP